MVALRRGFVAFVALNLLLGACAAREGDDIGSPIFDGTTPDGITIDPPITTLPIPEIDALRVPSQYFTIQSALDAAQAGDLILLDPGVYSEEVIVSTADVVIRGRDRNTVFVDGLHQLTTGISVRANGVAVENMTIRNYLSDGLIVEGPGVGGVGVDGFRAFHVTTSNTGRNGIVAVGARNVEITQVWSSGHGRAGVSIEACSPCDTVIQTTLAEFSARGISLTGTEDGATIFASTARNNRAGIVIEDGVFPTRGAIVAGSVVLNNGFSQTPLAEPTIDHAYGVGVHVSGTTGTRVEANAVSGNTRAGVLLGSSATNGELPAVDAIVVDNEIDDHPEGAVVQADAGTGVVWQAQVFETEGSIPYQNGPVPPGIEGMTGADSEPAVPAGPVLQPDVSSAVVPTF